MAIDVDACLSELIEQTPQASALMPIRARLASGQEAMTGELMLRIIESLDYMRVHPHPMNSLDPWDCVQIHEKWRQPWIEIATADWVDALHEVLLSPPPFLQPHSESYYKEFVTEELGPFYHEVTGRFPERAVERLHSLLSNKSTHRLMADVLFKFYVT